MMQQVFLAAFLVILIILSGGAAIAYLFPYKKLK